MQYSHTEYNPHKDATEKWYWDADNETWHIKNTFNVGDILQANKAQANLNIDGRFGNQRMHAMAEIPLVFVTKFLKEHNLDVFSTDPSEQKRLRRLLEDPEYRFLKTSNKKLWRPT